MLARKKQKREETACQLINFQTQGKHWSKAEKTTKSFGTHCVDLLRFRQMQDIFFQINKCGAEKKWII